jgi:hypothetical protein
VTTRHEHYNTGAGARRLWAGILVPPLAFLTALEAAYLLVPWACRHGREWTVYLGLLPGLAMLAVAAAGALRARREAGDGAGAEVFGQGGDVALDPGPSRIRFMATIGLLGCAFFTFLTLALAIPIIGLHPCD